MARKPFRVTALHEDLLKIGLISEEDAHAAEAEAQAAEQEAEEVKDLDDKLAHEGDEIEHQGEEDHNPEEEEEGHKVETEAEEAEEHARKLEQKVAELEKKLASLEMHHDSNSPPPENKNPMHVQKPAGAALGMLGQQESAAQRISNMLESSKQTLAESDQVTAADAIKGFAQISLVADKLAERLAEVAVQLQSEELAQFSDAYDQLAEEAAESAETLLHLSESDEDLNGSAIEEDFTSMTSALVEGLEIYADLVEEDESEEDDKKCKDCGKDPCECEKEEEKEEKKEESKK
jgi:hypothetical protein